jgi:hypothetical protein
MLSGGPVRVWRSLIFITWWKFLLIMRRRTSNSWAERGDYIEVRWVKIRTIVEKSKLINESCS